MSPLANSYLDVQQAQAREVFFPLCVYVCEKCLLVQLPAHQSSENIFSDYAYFSSYSDSWLKHAKTYADHMVQTYRFNAGSQVVEIASNDGYLLQYFVERGIPVLGIEPAKNVAKAAMSAGIPTLLSNFSVNRPLSN